MDSTGVVDLWRKEIADLATPSLWSDEEGYSFLDDAQKMFCRLTGGIPDSTSAMTTIPVGVGEVSFVYDERILKIRTAYRTSDGRPLRVFNQENMEKEGLYFDGRTGPLSTIVIGMDATVAFLIPIPSLVDTLRLTVDRLPLDDITLDAAPQDLEVAPHHHRHLMLWMKALAYLKQDAEAFDKSKSKEFDDKFRAYCFEAKIERERRIHKPRAVTYGGLQMNPQTRRDY